VGPCFTSPWWCWWIKPSERLPHFAYAPPVPGTYYFRPYSVIQLREQQAMAAVWGIDPRTPYSNDIFQRVYSEMGPSKPISGK
jgi:hypothetical protein